jgi:GH15 family glucan-1,4-alpha-glucosidase
MARNQGVSIDTDRWQAAANLLKSRAGAFYNTERGLLNKGYLLKENEIAVDSTLDISSFYGAYMFDYVTNSEHLASTLKAIETNLLDISPSGGSARYEDDNYFRSIPPYRGNPWFVTTLWIAQYYALQGQKDKATNYIKWALSNTLDSGLLSEQISPEDSKIVGVTPLVWSHAELINTILDTN